MCALPDKLYLQHTEFDITVDWNCLNLKVMREYFYYLIMHEKPEDLLRDSF